MKHKRADKEPLLSPTTTTGAAPVLYRFNLPGASYLLTTTTTDANDIVYLSIDERERHLSAG